MAVFLHLGGFDLRRGAGRIPYSVPRRRGLRIVRDGVFFFIVNAVSHSLRRSSFQNQNRTAASCLVDNFGIPLCWVLILYREAALRIPGIRPEGKSRCAQGFAGTETALFGRQSDFAHAPLFLCRFFCLFRRLTGKRLNLYNIRVFKATLRDRQEYAAERLFSGRSVLLPLCFCPVSAGGIFCFWRTSACACLTRSKESAAAGSPCPSRVSTARPWSACIKIHTPLRPVTATECHPRRPGFFYFIIH